MVNNRVSRDTIHKIRDMERSDPGAPGSFIGTKYVSRNCFTFVEKVRQTNLSLYQTKPIYRKAKMNVNLYTAGNYGELRLCERNPILPPKWSKARSRCYLSGPNFSLQMEQSDPGAPGMPFIGIISKKPGTALQFALSFLALHR